MDRERERERERDMDFSEWRSEGAEERGHSQRLRAKLIPDARTKPRSGGGGGGPGVGRS